MIGMVKHLIYNFIIFLSEIDKQNKSELSKKKHLLKDQNNLPRNEGESNHNMTKKQVCKNRNVSENSKSHGMRQSQSNHNKSDSPDIEVLDGVKRQNYPNRSNFSGIKILCEENSKHNDEEDSKHNIDEDDK